MKRIRALPIVTIVLLLLVPAPHGAEPLSETVRLAALCRVWGLVKYFDARLSETTVVDWDAALVRAIPVVRAAQNRDDLNRELIRLIRTADAPPLWLTGFPVAGPETDPAFSWIDDGRVIDPSVASLLKRIQFGRKPATNRFVKPGQVGNADFSDELPYELPEYPVVEMRLLALFRYWNMVQYFAPNRNLTDRPWADVLDAAIPNAIAARDAVQYQLAISQATSALDDAHAFTSSGVLAAHWGVNMAPLRTRLIESRTIVSRVVAKYASRVDVRVGDEVLAVDGEPVDGKRTTMRPYIWGSNPASVQRNIDSLLLRTSAERMTLQVQRGETVRTVTLDCPPVEDVLSAEEAQLDHTPYTMLPGNIGYVHMGWLQPGDVTPAMNALRSTRAIVFDLRNYPNGTLGLIGQFLYPSRQTFATATQPVYERPGTFKPVPPSAAGPATPSTTYYRGAVVVLVDERTQSQAEFTAMMFRRAPDVLLVGSQTAGADGDVSLILLPGGIRTYFSGLGIYYPDGSPTQRIGIVPDVEVTPTIAGLRSGRDEVLDAALALVR